MNKRTPPIAILLTCLIFGLGSCKTPAPTNIGLTKAGTLHPCPDSPNCVSTMEEATDKKHHIGAIYYESTMEEALEHVLATIKEMKGTEVITRELNYIHVEFTTRLMSFVDDVEFLIDDERKTIHFRSASRVGYSDMGANRRRMEKFKEAFYRIP